MVKEIQSEECEAVERFHVAPLAFAETPFAATLVTLVVQKVHGVHSPQRLKASVHTETTNFVFGYLDKCTIAWIIIVNPIRTTRHGRKKYERK